MKVGIVGSRSITNYKKVKEYLDAFKDITLSEIFVISGGAKGVDSLAIKWAKENNLQYKEILPDWDKYGKKAGMLRNTQIAEECDELIAFWDGRSKGTMDTFNKVKTMKKPAFLINLAQYKGD